MTTPASIVNYPSLTSPTTIDYTSKDWNGFVVSMLNYAKQAFPQWDTSSEGDFGVMLVELVAYMGDILSFYGDRLTQEAYLPTATQRLSILNLAQLLGYVPTNGSPATGTVTFQTASTVTSAIAIPAGTQVATAFNVTADAPIIYQTTAAATCPASGGTVTVNVSQGITTTQQVIGTSDGTAGQSFQIPTKGVEDGTVLVYVASVASPVQWKQVTFLVDSGPADTVFSLFTDQNGFTNVQFGDSINGIIPGIGLTIYATYTIGVGALGNQPAGSVGFIVNPITGLNVPFQAVGSQLYQSSAMTGGSNPETNDQIRANAPLSYTTQQRAVSLVDFANLALTVPGVLQAKAVGNHSTSVTLYVLGPNYLAPSTGLISNIQSFFQNKTLAGVTLSVGNPSLIAVDIGTISTGMTLQVLPNYIQRNVVANVTTALQSLLSAPVATFGMLLNVSQVYATIMGVAGVQYAIVNVMTREDITQANTNPIQFRQSEIPVAGNIYITASGGI